MKSAREYIVMSACGHCFLTKCKYFLFFIYIYNTPLKNVKSHSIIASVGEKHSKRTQKNLKVVNCGTQWMRKTITKNREEGENARWKL